MASEKSEEKQYKQANIFSPRQSPEREKQVQAEKILAAKFEELIEEVKPIRGIYRSDIEEKNLKGLKQLALEGKITQGDYQQALKSFVSKQERQEQAVIRFKSLVRELQKSGHEFEPQVIKRYIGHLVREYSLKPGQEMQLHVNLGVAGR